MQERENQSHMLTGLHARLNQKKRTMISLSKRSLQKSCNPVLLLQSSVSLARFMYNMYAYMYNYRTLLGTYNLEDY
jgi:hypothetical protein